jgi:hypothetical protein
MDDHGAERLIAIELGAAPHVEGTIHESAGLC